MNRYKQGSRYSCLIVLLSMSMTLIGCSQAASPAHTVGADQVTVTTRYRPLSSEMPSWRKMWPGFMTMPQGVIPNSLCGHMICILRIIHRTSRRMPQREQRTWAVSSASGTMTTA